LGYGYTDAKYTSFPGATPAGDDYSNNALPMSPKHSFSAVIEFQRPVADNWDLVARGEYTYRSKRWSDAANTRQYQADAYGLVNGRVGMLSTNNGIGVSLWVRNLLDKNYAIQIGPGGAFSPGAVYQSIGAERTYGIEVSYNWSR
jgi:iron complex outermembrane receptor protein